MQKIPFLFCFLYTHFILPAQNETYARRVKIADSLLLSGALESAARAYSFAFEAFSGRAYPDDRYKAARAWSRAGDADSAFFHLNRLVEKTDLPDDPFTKGKAEPVNLAYLEDRIRMRQGKPQCYGSQIVPDKETGAWVLYPVEDPVNLDKRRAAVGLGPIQDYLLRTGARMH